MMSVWPANNSNAHKLERRFPGRMGLLISPGGKRDPQTLPYGIDNAMYSAWKLANFSVDEWEQLDHWDGLGFLDLVQWALGLSRQPEWVVVPDVPGNAVATLRRFDEWAPRLAEAELRLAMAVQDGMTPSDVPAGVVAFVGGTTEWKWRNVARFAEQCEHTHVGRVNSYRRLWQCHELGVKSVDGTGWFRGDQEQKRKLTRYLELSSAGMKRDKQLELFG